MNQLRELLGTSLFTIEGHQTTFGALLAVIAVVLATVLLARLARNSVQRYMRQVHGEDESASRPYGVAIQIIVWLIGFELALHLLGIHLTMLLATGGFFALAGGLAAKSVVENLISGVILRVERTVKPGDVVLLDDKLLQIDRIGIRTIRARSASGEEVLVPNSKAAHATVHNLTRDDRHCQVRLVVVVSYESDVDQVRDALQQAVDGLDWTLDDEEANVDLRGFEPAGFRFEVGVWIQEAADAGDRHADLHEAVWRALSEAEVAVTGG